MTNITATEIQRRMKDPKTPANVAHARADAVILKPLIDKVYEMAHPSPFLPGTKIQYAWDSTSLGYLKTCPRLYQYIMIDGWSGAGENVHLRFGIEFHKALEDYDRKMAEGADRAQAIREVVYELLVRTQDFISDPETKAGKYKNRRTLLGLVIDYLDNYIADKAETFIKADGDPAVELSFRFELDWGPQDSEKGPNTQPYLLCGHLDRVVTFTDNLFGMDRKTSMSTLGQHYFLQYSPNNQMTLYTLALRVVLDVPVKGMIIDAAQILLEKPNSFQRGITYRTEDQLDEWTHDLRYWLEQAERYATDDYWPMNDTACDKFGGCRFRDICNKSPQVRPQFLKSSFTQLPPEERWNPLKPR